MFTAVLFIIAPKRNNPSIYHQGINKLWFIHIKEYSLRIKENELVIYTGTWTDLKIHMLNEQNQNKRSACTCHINISIYIKLYKIKVKNTESRPMVVRGWQCRSGEKAGGGEGGRILKEMRKSAGIMDMFNYLDCSDDFIILPCQNLPDFTSCELHCMLIILN